MRAGDRHRMDGSTYRACAGGRVAEMGDSHVAGKIGNAFAILEDLVCLSTHELRMPLSKDCEPLLPCHYPCTGIPYLPRHR